MSIRSRALPTNIEQNITDTVVTMKEVSGMGIQSNQEDVSTEDLMQMIQSINKTNQSAADLMLEEKHKIKPPDTSVINSVLGGLISSNLIPD